ncbi:MAG: hypothetical protein RLZZ373_1450, partial [Pseudomonadota bacterium]
MTASTPTSTAALYRQPVLLTREAHAGHRVAPVRDWRVAQGLNAVPVTAIEFIEAAREFPIAFVPTGQDTQGRVQVSPVLLLGLREGENLFVGPAGEWQATYLPAFLRRYPFAYAASEEGPLNLVVDAAWPGFGGETGDEVLDAAGEPTPVLQAVQQLLDNFERETVRTRVLCDRLVALDLLRGGEIQGALPDGQSLNAGGFYLIDEARLATLADEAV